MPFKSLREFLDDLDRRGELKKIDGADWNLEMGALTELMWEANGPALLFDSIKDYPRGYRVATNLFATKKRCLLALGMPEELPEDEAVEKFEEVLGKYKPLPPRQVSGGPVAENVLHGDDVDLFRFPAPKWHELDGGRYLGTGCCVIQKDPDGGWVNVATYRIAIHDRGTAGIFISEGHQGTAIEKRYWSKGQSCPVAVSLGHDPMLFLASSGGFGFDWGVSEYDVAGYFSGAPVDVIVDEYTGLPIPATAEIAIEGEVPPPKEQVQLEGPFGEWPGYYAHGAANEPVIRVKRLYYRNDPILCGAPPLKPPFVTFGVPIGAAAIWNYLEKADVPDIRGVWCNIGSSAAAGGAPFIIVSVKQRYHGHAQQAGLAALASRAGNYHGRFVIVVDDDIDPSDSQAVLWAMGTRMNPSEDIEIIRRSWSSSIDPMIPPNTPAAACFTSKAVFDACKPYEWRQQFPSAIGPSLELRASIYEKWKSLL